MKYWAYINNAVCGPFEKEKLAELSAFSLVTLLCPDTPGGARADSWKAASTYPEVLAVFGPAPAPAEPGSRANSPIMMTMRGTLIEEPAADEPVPAPQPASSSPNRISAGAPVIPEPAKEIPAAGLPYQAVAGNPVRPQPAPEPEQLREKLEHMSAMLVSIGNSQSQLLERLGRVESSVSDIKSLLFPAPPKK
ncbi:MAG: hypothetical protein Q8O90_10715 [Elusimicrobiota bacterium]|nr:hypothetical protein [Elusimicrobiota bacterium]